MPWGTPEKSGVFLMISELIYLNIVYYVMHFRIVDAMLVMSVSLMPVVFKKCGM